jgi:Protein of unknown function (DUF2905)
MVPLGKALFLFGIAIAGLGLIVWLLAGVPYVGHLPGDIYVRRGNFSFYFPLTTCILVSIVISVLFVLMRR